MSADVTRIIRRPVAKHDESLCMESCCMAPVERARPIPEGGVCKTCHTSRHRGSCAECVYVRRMFASVPKRGRALVGSGR